MWSKSKSATEVRAGVQSAYPRLWRYCLVLTRNRTQAEDLAQSTCLRALQKSDQFEPGTHVDRWLFRIAQRHWYNEVRKQTIRRGNGISDIEDVDLVDRKPDPESNILGQDVFNEVMALPEAQRTVVLLAYVEGYSYKECAETLDIPIGTVMSRLAAARAKLAGKFSDESK